MKKKLIIIAALGALAVLAGIQTYASTINFTPSDSSYVNFLSAPSKRLSASITSGATSFQLSDIKGWNGQNLSSADLGGEAYAVFRNDNNSAIEIMQIDPTSIASGTIVILKRGMAFNGNLTATSSARMLSWIKNTTIVELGTDVPQILGHMVQVGGAQTIAGQKTFTAQTTVQNTLIATSLLTSAFTVAGNANVTGNVTTTNLSVAGVTSSIPFFGATGAAIPLTIGNGLTLVGSQLNAGLLSVQTTTKVLYDAYPAATDDIPVYYADTQFTIKQADCVNDAGAGNTVTYNIIHGSTRNATGSLLFPSSITCTATSTVNSTTTFASSTILAGELIRVVFSAASSTGVYIDFKY